VITVPLVEAERRANPAVAALTVTLAVPSEPVVAVVALSVGVIAPMVVGALNVTVLPEMGFP
jgi:hypothetical protein